MYCVLCRGREAVYLKRVRDSTIFFGFGQACDRVQLYFSPAPPFVHGVSCAQPMSVIDTGRSGIETVAVLNGSGISSDVI